MIITGAALLLASFVVQASIPVPDLLPIGQLKLDRDTAEDASQEEEQVSGNSVEESGTENDVETAQDVLNEDAIGSSAILISDKTAEDYELAYERAKNANWGYTNLGIADVSDNLNIRAIAAEDGRLVGKLPRNAACEVIDTDDTWAHIKSGSVEGYVSLEYLLTGVPAKYKAEELAVTVAKVTTDGLNVRAEANTDSEVITLVAQGEELEVAAVEGDWVKVLLDDDEVYVAAEYVEVSAELSTAVTMTELLYGQGVSDVRVDICQYAKEFIGNPYVWGGTSLTKGADCSGFVMKVFQKYSVKLPRTSRTQANCGTTIKVSEAKPGDLIFYAKGKTINHVAIYIGNGQVVHASSPKTGIKISNVSYRTPFKAVRVLYD